MKCTSCGASLYAGMIRCPYCASYASPQLDGIDVYASEPAIGKPCPRCTNKLAVAKQPKLDGATVEICNSCAGAFFPVGLIEALIEKVKEQDIGTLEAELEEYIRVNSGIEPAQKPYIPCPACAVLMNRVNYGSLSGVVVDSCREHGLWLDAGELHRLLRWAKSGGLSRTEIVKAERERNRVIAAKDAELDRKAEEARDKSGFVTAVDSLLGLLGD